MTKFLHLLVVSVVAACAEAALADDAYYGIPIRDLKIAEGQFPNTAQPMTPIDWRLQSVLIPSGVLEGPGEIFLNESSVQRWTGLGGTNGELGDVAMRVPEGTKDIRGRLFLPRRDGKGALVGFAQPLDVGADEAAIGPFQAYDIRSVGGVARVAGKSCVGLMRAAAVDPVAEQLAVVALGRRTTDQELDDVVGRYYKAGAFDFGLEIDHADHQAAVVEHRPAARPGIDLGRGLNTGASYLVDGDKTAQ
ncbi:MAG: hypothetical protein ABSG53_12130 [Thermoguttaceae bacterium]